jgi:hypothetical protein
MHRAQLSIYLGGFASKPGEKCGLEPTDIPTGSIVQSATQRFTYDSVILIETSP